MTPLDSNTLEQLCAWMDGELPSDQARFLERRLAGDRELRAQWERWQLASACLRGQPLRLMRNDIGERVLSAISDVENSPTAAKRRPVWGWAVAASLAVLALLIGVQLRPEKIATNPASMAHVGDSSTVPIAASPASADLVALNVAPAPGLATPQVAAADMVTPAPTGKATAAVRPSATEVADAQSLMPLDSQSPTQFPLQQTSGAKTWPRSPLSSSGNDVSMEAYLVRHNEMVNGGGLGGFVPYVDVVTRERGDASGDGTDNAVGDDKQ
jgi:negative regulator of sigma E activity